jgi:transposase
MAGRARFIGPDRKQARWDMVDLEGLLPADHRARVVWAFVEGLDLSAFYDAIKSREGEAGRPAADPAVLLALWLFATVEGVGSARALERLAESDVAYRWLAGGVPVNYHGLADFRVDHVELLDELLTESVTALIDEGLVSLQEIAVDGTKVRACASMSSFKTERRLAEIEAEVAARLAALKAELESDPAACSRRKWAARERAAREVEKRASQARKALDRVRAERQERAKRHAEDEAKKSEPKASTSDVEARCMRFADGAIRPAFNAQIAAAPEQGIIISVEMTDRRNDSGLAPPMVDDIVHRYGKAPQNLLVDTTYATVEDIAVLAAHAAGPVTVYAPVPKEREDVTPGTLRKRKSKRSREPESVKKWRERMGTDAGHKVYARRKLIERLNAQCKNHGFGILRVRGLVKAKAVALMHALGNNLTAAHRLRTATA